MSELQSAGDCAARSVSFDETVSERPEDSPPPVVSAGDAGLSIKVAPCVPKPVNAAPGDADDTIVARACGLRAVSEPAPRDAIGKPRAGTDVPVADGAGGETPQSPGTQFVYSGSRRHSVPRQRDRWQHEQPDIKKQETSLPPAAGALHTTNAIVANTLRQIVEHKHEHMLQAELQVEEDNLQERSLERQRRAQATCERRQSDREETQRREDSRRTEAVAAEQVTPAMPSPRLDTGD